MGWRTVTAAACLVAFGVLRGVFPQVISQEFLDMAFPVLVGAGFYGLRRAVAGGRSEPEE